MSTPLEVSAGSFGEIAMKRALLVVMFCLSVFSILGCATAPGQVKRELTPGHIQKHTGYNPASGKMKKM